MALCAPAGRSRGQQSSQTQEARSLAIRLAPPPSSTACFTTVTAPRSGRQLSAVVIRQDLVDQHGFAGRYASVRRYLRRVRGGLTPEPSGIIETGLGAEAQADYGEGPMVRDPTTGKYRRTRRFVMTLGYSRISMRLLAWRSMTLDILSAARSTPASPCSGYGCRSGKPARCSCASSSGSHDSYATQTATPWQDDDPSF